MVEKRNLKGKTSMNGATPAVIETGMSQLATMSEKEIVDRIDNSEICPIKANAEHWSPKIEGESITVYFMGFIYQMMPSLKKEGQKEKVLCAYLAQKLPDKTMITITCAATVLVSYFADGLIVDENGFQATPIDSMWEIVFTGTKKNTTNSKSSNNFNFYRRNPKD